MFKIRKNMFETNSSSVHTLTICKEEDFDKWKNNEYGFMDIDTGEYFDSIESACNHIIQINKEWYDKHPEYIPDFTEDTLETILDFINDSRIETYSHWNDEEYIESYIHKYTTESGDKIVIFGKYGYDG